MVAMKVTFDIFSELFKIVNIMQVVFEGKVIGQHSTDIGLDDVTFTPQCQLKFPCEYLMRTVFIQT